MKRIKNRIKDIFVNPEKYRKIWVHVVSAVVLVLNAVVGDNNPYVLGVVLLAEAYGIEELPNEPWYPEF